MENKNNNIKYNNNNMPIVSIKNIYKNLGIKKYDVRLGRTYLIDRGYNITNKTPKPRVEALIRDIYDEIIDETKRDLYVYTLKGEARQLYQVRDPNNKNQMIDKWTKPKSITTQFQSWSKYNLQKNNLTDIELPLPINLLNNYPTLSIADDLKDIFGTEEIANKWFNSKGAEGSNKILTLNSVSVRVYKKRVKKLLKEMPLFSSSIELPDNMFNGFKDSGNMMCVPETLLHHLKLGDKNKKMNISKIIDELESIYPPDNDDYDENGELIVEEKIERGKRGYTGSDIERFLTNHRYKFRLLDINENQFLTNVDEVEEEKNKKVFVGIVYDNHLYYCDDAKFVKSLGERMKKNCNGMTMEDLVYKKEFKKKESKLENVVIEKNDLTDYYVEHFENRMRKVDVRNGLITKITYEDRVVYANPEKTIMDKILGEGNFTTENTTTIGNEEYKQYGEIEKSSFIPSVFEKLVVNGGIKHTINYSNDVKLHEYDINKCRTDCLFNNRLGDYEVFNVSCDIHIYSGKIKKGIYWVEIVYDYAKEFFLKGNNWYSGDFIKKGMKENFGKGILIKYEILASSTIDENYFKGFVSHIVMKYGDNSKSVVNKFIGGLGKTRTSIKKGYIETDINLAMSAFWDYNEDNIGSYYDYDNEMDMRKKLKGKLCSVNPIDIAGEEYYLVENEVYKTLYDNNLPIYNKILENEYLRLYELGKMLNGKIIKYHTDAIIVAGEHKKPKLSIDIGGYKYRQINNPYRSISDSFCNKKFDIESILKWNITEEKKIFIEGDTDNSYSVDIPNGSYLITALAGYGKTTFVKKNIPEYHSQETLKLGFTNVSTKNLQEEEHPSYTLNSYLGVDCMTGKVCEKNIKNLKKFKTIIITEVFMTPAYLMKVLLQIKKVLPHIKFICEGDPKQLRPVGEEGINWINTQLLYELCDGNMIKLLYNKRNNETENYNKIFKGEMLDLEKYEYRKYQNLNIVKTNKMRKHINNEKMDKSGYFIAESSNEYSQDIYLTLETPIMCIKNNKKLNLKNGEILKIKHIEKDNIIVGNDIIFNDNKFAEYFVVCYAMTNHKVQGITIKEPYNIYEWGNMNERERYTAYSRTSDGNNVRINSNFYIR